MSIVKSVTILTGPDAYKWTGNGFPAYLYLLDCGHWLTKVARDHKPRDPGDEMDCPSCETAKSGRIAV